MWWNDVDRKKRSRLEKARRIIFKSRNFQSQEIRVDLLLSECKGATVPELLATKATDNSEKLHDEKWNQGEKCRVFFDFWKIKMENLGRASPRNKQLQKRRYRNWSRAEKSPNPTTIRLSLPDIANVSFWRSWQSYRWYWWKQMRIGEGWTLVNMIDFWNFIRIGYCNNLSVRRWRKKTKSENFQIWNIFDA